jgi:hypothetical protein
MMASLDRSASYEAINEELMLKRLNTMGMPADLVQILLSWLTDRATRL